MFYLPKCVRATALGTALAASGLASVSACKGRPDAPVANVRSVDAWSNDNRCIFRYALNPTIKVCMQNYGVDAGSFARAQADVKGALGEWLDRMRDLNNQVTSTIEFGCTAGYVQVVNVMPGAGVDTSGPGSPLTMYLSNNYGVAANRGTLLHEYGHAFACLGDTYTNGTSGYCQAGQPPSIMCWGGDGPSASDHQQHLWPDDIAGGQRAFLTYFPRTAAAKGAALADAPGAGPALPGYAGAGLPELAAPTSLAPQPVDPSSTACQCTIVNGGTGCAVVKGGQVISPVLALPPAPGDDSLITSTNTCSPIVCAHNFTQVVTGQCGGSLGANPSSLN